jgi:hypothetical protein
MANALGGGQSRAQEEAAGRQTALQQQALDLQKQQADDLAKSKADNKAVEDSQRRVRAGGKRGLLSFIDDSTAATLGA